MYCQTPTVLTTLVQLAAEPRYIGAASEHKVRVPKVCNSVHPAIEKLRINASQFSDWV